MIFFSFLCIFAFLINKNFISYNENFLLCLFFILFFIIAYIFTKKLFKETIFKKIYKNYFLLLFVICLTRSFNKLTSYINIIKYNTLIKYSNKIFLLKKKFIINLNNIFNYCLIVLNFLYFFSLNRKIKFNKNFINTYLDSIFNLKINDIFIFF